MKFEYEEKMKELEETIEEREGDADSLEEEKQKLKDNIGNLKKDLEASEDALKKVSYTHIEVHIYWLIMKNIRRDNRGKRGRRRFARGRETETEG